MQHARIPAGRVMPLQLHASPCQSAISRDVTIHMNERLELMWVLIDGRNLWESRVAASNAWNNIREDSLAANVRIANMRMPEQPSTCTKNEGSIAMGMSLD